jgi:arsenate reductase
LGLLALQKKGIATDALSSKHWDIFATADAPAMDVIVTVCDNAAGEVCPIWPGHPVSVHWGYADPSAVVGDAAAMQAAFDDTLSAINKRLTAMLDLPLSALSGDALRRALQALDHV